MLKVLRNLLLAAPVVPIVAVASLAAIALSTASASLLVIPGIWVMVRWSLFAPVIITELLGPLAALKRSNELVFLTSAFAVVLEEVVADGGLSGPGVDRLGDLGRVGGGSVATIVILPVASFATALVYGHLRRLEDPGRDDYRAALSQLAKPHPYGLVVFALL